MEGCKVTHIMADGQKRDSIEGAVIPPSMTQFYNIVSNIIGKKKEVGESVPHSFADSIDILKQA